MVQVGYNVPDTHQLEEDVKRVRSLFPHYLFTNCASSSLTEKKISSNKSAARLKRSRPQDIDIRSGNRHRSGGRWTLRRRR